jgi:hypothetical protein
MKKILLIIALFFSFFMSANADEYNDYTLIDCINWNDNTASPLDSSKPYASLKEWIEETIANINANTEWDNADLFKGKIFKIKVKCAILDIKMMK